MARQFSMVPLDSIIRVARLLGQEDAPLALFSYLRTGPHTNSLGVSRVPLLYVAADLGRTEKWARTNLQKLVDAGLVISDEQNDLIMLKGQLREEGLSNLNVVSFARKLVAGLPNSPEIFQCLLDQAESLGRDFIAPLIQDLRDRLRGTQAEPFQNGSVNGFETNKKENKKEKEKEKEKKKKGAAAAPPRLLALDGGRKRGGEGRRVQGREETAKDRRARLFEEAQAIYPIAFERHLSGEVYGRNAYAKDLKDNQALGFNSEAELHRQVLESIRAHAASTAWNAESGKFIPGIGRFFRDRRWRSNPTSAQGPLEQLSRAGRTTAENAAQALRELEGEAHAG
ncbi:MAG: hypothetical protein KKE29_12880 [Proteobacteria bacterium]|nr:hypothetical protein [Pseudomonadota bacterium]MBU4599072.1 hypothetical protein [Pseudomonadota bacterium]MBV1714875.1 hypothetical protein [Desulfarculus sp.]